jgi:signal transduction histidine kinase
MVSLIDKKDNKNAKRNVKMIDICLQSLVMTTNNILEMSKIRQGKFKANNKETNIIKKIASIQELFQDDFRMRQIEYEPKIHVALSQQTIMLDDQRFGIVLYNLLSNSVKHTNGGIIKISAKLLS